MKNYLLPVFLFLGCIASCQHSDSYSSKEYAPQASAAYDEMSEAEESYPQEESNDNKMKVTERKIIRDAEMSMEVKDVRAFYPEVESKVGQFGGYISDTDLENNSYRISNDIVIRVPADKLDSLLTQLESKALYIPYSRMNSTDVTEEYTDIEIRLQTKREVRERYLKILREQAETVEEVLLAEEQIRTLTEEIEAKEGRLRYLQNRTGLSTLRLNIYQQTEGGKIYRKSYLTKIGEGFVNGWQMLSALFLGLINIWPLLLIFFLILWKRKAIWRKIRGR